MIEGRPPVLERGPAVLSPNGAGRGGWAAKGRPRPGKAGAEMGINGGTRTLTEPGSALAGGPKPPACLQGLDKSAILRGLPRHSDGWATQESRPHGQDSTDPRRRQEAS